MEIYVPFMMLMIMVEMVISIITFLDVDAFSHRYHDFSGVLGIALIVTKSSLWLYFLY